MDSMDNLFSSLPADLRDEVVSRLVDAEGCRIERIVSQGHASPAGYWYDQDQPEWVVLLAGAARLQIEGRAEPLHLSPGDYIHLPAHQRHRVEWTTPHGPTIWLAVHYRARRVV